MARSEYHEYDPVGHSSEEKYTGLPFSNPDSEDQPFLHRREPVRSSNLKWTLPWILCALFATTSGILTFLLLHPRENLNSQRGYVNDFRKSIVKTENINVCLSSTDSYCSRPCNNSSRTGEVYWESTNLPERNDVA